jgi:hypothetical protein
MSSKPLASVLAALILFCASDRAYAQADTFRFQFPTPTSLFDPCNLDTVIFSGGFTLEVTRTSTTNGIQILSKLTSVGTGTGTVAAQRTYHMNDTQTFQANVRGFVDSFEVTNTESLKLIGPNQGDNFILQAVLHITATPAGVPSAVIDNLTTRCQ